MEWADIDQRLAAIEKRLSKLEGVQPQDLQADPPVTEQPPQDPAPSRQVTQSVQQQFARRAPKQGSEVTTLLGIGGIAALVLASVYLIRLAWLAGWLTPERQVLFAALGGVTMIILGLILSKSDRKKSGTHTDYFSLLPAGGLVVLYVSVFAAQFVYQLIGELTAMGALTLICFGAIALGFRFASGLYSFFAVVGSYLVPLFFTFLRNDVFNLAIYFTGWSVIFCTYAIRLGDRRVYLTALFLGLIVFNFIADKEAQWLQAAGFQLLQLAIFSTGTAVFSIKQRQPLSEPEAWMHFAALVLFYFLEYRLLEQSVPQIAPWIAVCSAVFVTAVSLVAEMQLKNRRPSAGTYPVFSRIIAANYCALVFAHAVYFQLVPAGARPWIGALALPVLYLIMSRIKSERRAFANVSLAILGFIFLWNYLKLLVGGSGLMQSKDPLLALVYAAELYTGAYFMRRAGMAGSPQRYFFLYGAHLQAMAAIVALVDNRLGVSVIWAVLAVASLILAIVRRDRDLGQSSLLILLFSSGKVFFYDLTDATPSVRVYCLLILGVTLYGAGWLYKKLPHEKSVDSSDTKTMPFFNR